MTVKMFQTFHIFYKDEINERDIQKIFENGYFKNFQTPVSYQYPNPKYEPTSPLLKFSDDAFSILIGNYKYERSSRGAISFISKKPLDEDGIKNNFKTFISYLDFIELNKKYSYIEFNLNGEIGEPINIYKYRDKLESMDNPKYFGLHIFDGKLEGNLREGPWKEILIQPNNLNANKYVLVCIYRFDHNGDIDTLNNVFTATLGDLNNILLKLGVK